MNNYQRPTQCANPVPHDPHTNANCYDMVCQGRTAPAPPAPRSMNDDNPRFRRIETLRVSSWSENGTQVFDRMMVLPKHHPQVSALLYDAVNPATNVVVTYPDGNTILYERSGR